MLATSNVCAWPCALLQPLRQFRRPAPCRLLKPVAAAAASATQQQGDVHSSSVMPVRDQDRLQLDVERKLGIPREIYDRVRGQKSPGAVCLCVLGGWARAAEGACLVALSWYAVLSTDIQARMLLQPIRLPLHGLLQAGGVRVRQHVNPLKKELQVPIDPPAWAGAYERPQQPLVLDVGCGYGRFLLALRWGPVLPGRGGPSGGPSAAGCAPHAVAPLRCRA
jgi:hypothetical protein